MNIKSKHRQWFLLSGAVILAMTFPLMRHHAAPRAEASIPPDNSATSSDASETPTVTLSTGQLSAVTIGTVGTYAFPIIKTGIGTIDFGNNFYADSSLSTPVFPQRAGKIDKVFVELGDQVKKGQPLYSIETVSGNQPETMVRSPIAGLVTSVNATPGMLAQTSGAPAPCLVAAISTKWLLASVTESDSPAFHIGQNVTITVADFPGEQFEGKISKIFPTVDPVTHRLTIRAAITDPDNELREGMLADYSVQVAPPVASVALPADGIVREGDGTMTAWVTTDRKHFMQRTVKTGLHEDGEVQILAGLKPGETAVTDGAIFLDNMLNAPPDD